MEINRKLRASGNKCRIQATDKRDERERHNVC